MRTAILKFADHLKAIEKADLTIHNYTGDLLVLDRYLREREGHAGLERLGTVTSAMLDRFYEHLVFMHLSKSTRNGYVTAIRRFFTRAVERQEIPVDPSKILKYIPLHYNPRRSKRQPFTDKELLRICKACGTSRHAERDMAIIMVALATALRCSEICRLNVGDVDMMRAGSVYVKIKGDYEDEMEEVAVAPFCLPALDTYLAKRGSIQAGDPMFLTQKHTRMDRKAIHASLQKIQVKAGLTRTGVHLFRHTTLTRVMDKSYLLGRDIALHGARSVTDRYGHTNLEERMEAIESAYKNFLTNFFPK